MRPKQESQEKPQARHAATMDCNFGRTIPRGRPPCIFNGSRNVASLSKRVYWFPQYPVLLYRKKDHESDERYPRRAAGRRCR